MTLPARRMRAGFSLIELLIVVAIIAALVGVAVPFFRTYTGEAQRSKAEMDLQVLRKAIHRYQGAHGHFGGASFEPLLGSFLQEIPRDPWRNEYFLDANLGILGSFAGDGGPGGEGPDRDIVIRYLPPLSIFKASYEGPLGIPRDGKNRLRMWTTKPFHVVEPFKDQIPRDVVLRKSPTSPDISFETLGFVYDEAASNPAKGLLELSCCVQLPATNPNDTHQIRVGGEDFVNLSPLVLGFVEAPTANSPLFEVAAAYTAGAVPIDDGTPGLSLAR